MYWSTTSETSWPFVLPESHSFRSILRVLNEQGVNFVVIGGVSAVLQGAPINTFDLDVVHARDSENVDRLMRALAVLEAKYRVPGHSDLCPEVSHLASTGHQLLMTRFGPMDLLGEVGSGRDYEQLVGDTITLELDECGPVRVLRLQMIIALKEERGDEKDLAVLPILRRLLKETQQRDPA